MLELACGLLPRAYLFAKNKTTYVETDLENLVKQKKRMYKSVFPKLPKTLFLEKANALDKKELFRAARHFSKKKPIVVTHEGLLRYLNFGEKTLVAKNIHALLEEYGGVWITCDITLARMLPKQTLKKIKDRIGMDLSKNAFRNEKHAKKFFEGLGFNVKIHKLKEIQGELSTPKLLGVEKQKVAKMLDFFVFEMKIKR
jgi:O-methyltransferase involved in polyketide biosynthesis